MALLDTVRRSIVPIHREGWRFIAMFVIASFIVGMLSDALFWIGIVLAAWCAYFFRDPARVTPLGEGLVVSPADGRVSAIMEVKPPKELAAELGDQPLTRISVFMNVFDVHVNRAPVTGRITRIAYKPGLFLNAELDKASEDNERNGFVIDTVTGVRVGAVQIAGLVARRIVTFVNEQEPVTVGDRIGLIRFGSRVDVFLPRGTRPRVAVGQRAIAGETIFAHLSETGPAHPVRVS